MSSTDARPDTFTHAVCFMLTLTFWSFAHITERVATDSVIPLPIFMFHLHTIFVINIGEIWRFSSIIVDIWRCTSIRPSKNAIWKGNKIQYLSQLQIRCFFSPVKSEVLLWVGGIGLQAFQNLNSDQETQLHISHKVRKFIFGPVYPGKTQISLCICTHWSESAGCTGPTL